MTFLEEYLGRSLTLEEVDTIWKDKEFSNVCPKDHPCEHTEMDSCKNCWNREIKD